MLTENEAKLRFESCTYISTKLGKIAEHFPEFSFSLHVCFREINVEGTTVWANGDLAEFEYDIRDAALAQEAVKALRQFLCDQPEVGRRKC